MTRESLSKANKAKIDEFYTQFNDINKEIQSYIDFNSDVFRNKTILLPCDDPEWSNFTKFFAQNFERFGIKKLISTSYANKSKGINQKWQPTLFETENPNFDKTKTETHGKIFTLTHDTNQNGRIDIEDLEWNYLSGDGDFRSDEIKKLRDEADIIITNPPFSLFREFLNWIMEANKQFIIVGNPNSITCKEVFPLIKENKIWLGIKSMSSDMYFYVPDEYKQELVKTKKEGSGYVIKENEILGRTQAIWFTNIDFGKRHEKLKLMPMNDNIKFSKHKEIRNTGYQKYDNYDAIEVPFTDAIPSDYDGIMGVPISFLDKYCPEQFEIVGLGNSRDNFTPNKDYVNPKKILKNGNIVNGGAINCVLTIKLNNKPNNMIYYISNENYLIAPYARILIKRKQS